MFTTSVVRASVVAQRPARTRRYHGIARWGWQHAVDASEQQPGHAFDGQVVRSLGQPNVDAPIKHRPSGAVQRAATSVTREPLTTLTEDKDIAAAAKGGRSHPVHGNKSPAAVGR